MRKQALWESMLETQIPTGRLLPVEGTPMDFTNGLEKLGPRMERVDGGGKPGIDHCFARSKDCRTTKVPLEIAVLHHEGTGRTMRVLTTQPAVQLYTGNFMTGEGKHGVHGGLCLETQHFPDAIHHEHFPSTVLHPGEVFLQSTIHKFE